MSRKVLREIIEYLQQHRLVLTTAESCTAGLVIAQLADVEGCGSVLECGYVVYAETAKKRLLNVQQQTIDRFNLTSEPVALEMAAGALHDSKANVAVATTGVAGPDAVDGIPAGTICFAWGFDIRGVRYFHSETRHFEGDRNDVQHAAALHALKQIPHYHSHVFTTAS
jgi:PncC family amidohydrolase